MNSEAIIPPTIFLILSPLFALFVGLLVGVLIEKFKNRLCIISYDIYVQNLKPNLSPSLTGKIRITLNDRVIHSLRTAYVKFKNKSYVDLENVAIKFNISSGGVIQGGEGYLSNDLSWLNWTESYNTFFENILAEYKDLPINENGLRNIPDELQNKIKHI